MLVRPSSLDQGSVYAKRRLLGFYPFPFGLVKLNGCGLVCVLVSACFLGALQAVAGKAGKKDAAANAKIHASVHIGTPEKLEGFAVNVDLKVEGVQDEKLIKAAHEVRDRDCLPFSSQLLN